MDSPKSQNPAVPRRSRFGRNLLIIGIIYLLLCIYADMVGLMNNDVCYRLLGCNAGFFGYDAFRHLTSGIIEFFVFVWIVRRYPILSLRTNSFWKDILILLSIVTLVGFFWEMGEFVHDHWRMDVLHRNLVNPNFLDQASNADTMGDFTFNLIGVGLTAAYLKARGLWRQYLPL